MVVGVEAVVALIAAGFGALWLRRTRARRDHDAFHAGLDTDAEIAIHVAQHEARQRGADRLTPLHVLYGCLQVESVTDAVRRAGGDPDALESDALDRIGDRTPELVRDGELVLARVWVTARRHERPATIVDLWTCLLRTTLRPTIDARVDGRVVAVALAHRASEPEITGTGDVLVVLRNDDYSSFELVIEVLTSVFGTSEDEARRLALHVHETGRGVVGRFSVGDARAKIADARNRASEHGAPLWIATEPA